MTLSFFQKTLFGVLSETNKSNNIHWMGTMVVTQISAVNISELQQIKSEVPPHFIRMNLIVQSELLHHKQLM